MVAGRTILLCDLDAFFAAVEVLERPELAGKPVVVGGDPRSRGVVATCSYEARRYGIRSAMPLAEAHRRCPHAVFLPVRHELYRRYSQQVFAVYRRFTPRIEPVSIDEAYLDLGAQPGLPIAQEIKRLVKQSTGLTVSLGIGPNKFLAKLACELSKPDGLREIRSEDAVAVLAPLPVQYLPGIGAKTAKLLGALGVHRIGDLQRKPLAWFRQTLGRRGDFFYGLAHGRDERPVQSAGRAKSISDETTLPRDRKAGELLPVLMACCEQVGRRLRAAGLRAQTITIKVRFSDFVTITRSRTLPSAIATDWAIFQVARELYREHVLHAGRPGQQPVHSPLVRLVGVQVSNLQDDRLPRQTTLFDGELQDRAQVDGLIDQLRTRYGTRALFRGARLDAATHRD